MLNLIETNEDAAGFVLAVAIAAAALLAVVIAVVRMAREDEPDC